ncbi:MAG: hypothetical protein ACK6DS_08835 [Planctomycetota bacterium]
MAESLGSEWIGFLGRLENRSQYTGPAVPEDELSAKWKWGMFEDQRGT